MSTMAKLPTGGITRLPQELWDCVIDCLHDQRRTLAASSETCRAWVLRARLHHFHAVSLTADHFDAFLSLLQSDLNTIEFVIRDLTISTTLVLDVLVEIFRRLPSIETLRIKTLLLQPGVARIFYSVAHSLKQLELATIVGEVRDLFDILCCFEALETLSFLENSTRLVHGSFPDRLPAWQSSLRDLHIEFTSHSGNAQVLIKWLLSLKVINRIRSLSIHCPVEFGKRHTLALEMLLQFLGPSVERLHLELHSSLVKALQHMVFNLVYCKNLHEITIDAGNAARHVCRPDWLPLFLSRLQTTSIRRIHLIFGPDSTDLVRESWLFWTATKTLPFPQRQFPSLESVTCEVRLDGLTVRADGMPLGREYIEGELRRRLAHLDAINVLSINVKPRRDAVHPFRVPSAWY